MPEPSLFRHYQIVQDADGGNVELTRNAEQVCVLAFDTQQLEFVHCHVLLEPLANRPLFEETCRKLQRSGHPLLARVGDSGEDDGNPFYITANVDGETLRGYFSREQDLPAWLGVMTACRAMEAAIAICERGDYLTPQPLDSLRILQTGPHMVLVMAADYRLLTPAPGQPTRPAFDKQAKHLKAFFQEQIGATPMQPDHPLPGHELGELLGACLTSAGASSLVAMRELRAHLYKLLPEHLSGEIATAHKPRALIAPHLASYQEVARTVVNLVRIQSQRLDMTNPYSMRGTLTKTGRSVLVEEVPPFRITGSGVTAADEKAFQSSQKREFPSLVNVVLLHEFEGVTCVAEELVEGISLADVLRERRCLGVHEAYLVLAGLDAALTQLEVAHPDLRKLRLEDIFLLTGFPRDDARSAKLLLTKLNEWPAFSIVLRGHPTLASISGRGLDPAVLLPVESADTGGKHHGLWQGAWLAAVGRFLLALEPHPGIHVDNPGGGARERDMVSRFLDEEIAKARDGQSAKRPDFLARYARMVHHQDTVKPAPAPVSELLKVAVPPPKSAQQTPAKPVPATRPLKEVSRPASPVALTAGIAPVAEKPTIGFAELLFRGSAESEDRPAGIDWAKTAADAPPTIHPSESLLPPDDYVPLWLRAAVFIGGSLVLGAVLAHLSGHAVWQNMGPGQPPPLPAAASPLPSAAKASSPERSRPPATVPKAVPVDRASAGPAAPPVIIQDLPPEKTVPGAGGVDLKPPSGLKDLLIEPPAPRSAK